MPPGRRQPPPANSAACSAETVQRGGAHIGGVAVHDLQALDGEHALPPPQRLAAAAVLADDAPAAAAHLALAGEDLVHQPEELAVNNCKGGNLRMRPQLVSSTAARRSVQPAAAIACPRARLWPSTL